MNAEMQSSVIDEQPVDKSPREQITDRNDNDDFADLDDFVDFGSGRGWIFSSRGDSTITDPWQFDV